MLKVWKGIRRDFLKRICCKIFQTGSSGASFNTTGGTWQWTHPLLRATTGVAVWIHRGPIASTWETKFIEYDWMILNVMLIGQAVTCYDMSWLYSIKGTNNNIQHIKWCYSLDTFAFWVAQIIHRMDRLQIAIPFTAWGKSHEISWRRSDWRLLLQARKARFFLWVASLVANSYLDARYESPFAHKTNASTIHECQQKCVRLSKLGWLSMNVWCHLLGFDRIWYHPSLREIWY